MSHETDLQASSRCQVHPSGSSLQKLDSPKHWSISVETKVTDYRYLVVVRIEVNIIAVIRHEVLKGRETSGCNVYHHLLKGSPVISTNSFY